MVEEAAAMHWDPAGNCDACTLLQRTWLLCVSTFAQADSLVNLGKGVRLRNHKNESFAGARLVVTLN